MFSGPSRTVVLLDLDVGVQRVDRLLGRVDLRHADPLAGVDHLALEVGQVDLVVVDDPERADAGRGEVQRGRRAEAAGAEQQHLGVEQLLLALGADLGQQQVARVALALLGGQRPRDLDLVAAVLPQREAAGHRLDVLVAEVLDQRPRRPRRAVARRRSTGSRAATRSGAAPSIRDSEIALGDVLGAGDVPGRPLLGLAHVDHDRAVARPARARRRDRPRRSWLLIWRRTSAPDGLIRENSSKAVGIQYFSEYSAAISAAVWRQADYDCGAPR